jgi:hypothetical protein
MLLRTKQELSQNAAENTAQNAERTLLIFDDFTGSQVDFDFSGTPEEVVNRAIPPASKGPGRPRLGVVPKEVTLLPRHWEWLEEQPNGASATLRRLVDEARKKEPAMERSRRARDAASRFMWSMGGNLPNFEEASRALFAGDGALMRELIREWPSDVRDHVDKMVQVSEQHALEHHASNTSNA